MPRKKATAAAPAQSPPKAGRKQETHARVLRAAARALRRQGPTRVGVLEIMREAGLTHGGFYAHFASKDDLIAEAIGWMFAETRARIAARAVADPETESLPSLIDRYVSPAHRDDPGHGCPLTTLTGDMPHASAPARAAFDAGVAAMAERVARRAPGSSAAAKQQQALSLIAEMVGAVALSRAVSDPALSDAILQAARGSLKARHGGEA